MSELLAALLAVSSWAAPQPTLSRGLLVVYGGQRLVQANANYHGYSLAPTHGCGLASISPAMLGRVAWVSVDGIHFVGPCLVVDVVGRDAAFDSIWGRHEVAEVSRATAAALGFTHGAQGYISFSDCPPTQRVRCPALRACARDLALAVGSGTVSRLPAAASGGGVLMMSVDISSGVQY